MNKLLNNDKHIDADGGMWTSMEYRSWCSMVFPPAKGLQRQDRLFNMGDEMKNEDG